MRNCNQRKANIRKSSGYCIAEFGPSIFVLLFCMLFPALDLLGLTALYGAGAILNHMQLREASLVPASVATDPTGPIKKSIPVMWSKTGLSLFARVNGNIQTDVSYSDGEEDTYGVKEKFVRVTTSFSLTPFVIVPFPMSVPGLNSPIQYTYSSQRHLEDPTNADV